MSNREQTPAGHGELVIWIADSRYVKQGTDRPAAPDLSSARLVPREQAVWKKHSCQEPPACSGLQCDTCHLKVDCSLVQKSRVEEEARVWSRHKLLREHGLHKLIRGTNFSEEVTAQTPQRTRAALVTRMTMGKRRLTALKNCDLGGGWVHCPASVQLCQEYGSLFVRFFLT